jgi:hypothetical protein
MIGTPVTLTNGQTQIFYWTNGVWANICTPPTGLYVVGP